MTSTAVLTTAERRLTAHHEAAHAIVARVLGANRGIERIRGVQVYPGITASGRAAHCEYGMRERGDVIPQAAMWAGAVAEQRLIDGPDFTLRKVRDRLRVHRDDQLAIQERDFELHGGLDLDTARAAVEKLWGPITELAASIEATGTARDADVLRVLNLDNAITAAVAGGGDPVAQGLNALRRRVLGMWS